MGKVQPVFVNQPYKQRGRHRMKLDFNTTEETHIQKFRGGEKETIAKMFTDEHNRIMLGRLVPGAFIGLHTHGAGSEIVYILSGNGKAVYDGGQETLTAGDCHYCPKGGTATGSGKDLVFFAVIPQQ